MTSPNGVAPGPRLELPDLPWNPVRPLRAIVFDLDGTLYRAAPLRRRMALRLIRAYAFRPLEGWRVARVLRSYRRAQESLRATTNWPEDLERAQREGAARESGSGADEVEALVERWMRREPNSLLRDCMDRGERAFLESVARRGIRFGLLSDYPAESKLEAMGIRDRFDQIVTAQDREVQRFKPDPRGLEIALARLGVAKEEALYVGDRADVDGLAAERAGVACVLIGERPRVTRWPAIRRFDELEHAIAG